MRRKDLHAAPDGSTPVADTLRDELEQLGVAPGAADDLAERLRGLARELSAREYRALLDGVALGRHHAGSATARSPELRHILEDFASELKKLDEGMRLLTAYLSRLRDQTAMESARTLH